MFARKVLSAAAALAASLLLAAPPLQADVLSGGHELVVLAEPAAPAAPDGSGPMDLTLTWAVREIFAGDPDSVTIAVRHRGLEPAQVRSLAAGERWIVLADRDRQRPGRWVSSMPLRATPAAIAAFRKWSAPADVRPERDLGSVLAEVQEAEPEVRQAERRPSPPLAEAPPIVDARPVAQLPPAPVAESTVAEGPVVETLAADASDSPVDRDAAPAGISDERIVVVDSRDWTRAENVELLEPPETEASFTRAAEPVAYVRIAEVNIPAEAGTIAPAEPVRIVEERRGPTEEPPHTWKPALQPPTGPGLPPPPPARPLGPPPSRRDDLKKAKVRGDEGA